MEYQLVISGTVGPSWWQNGVTADYVRYVLNRNKDREVHVGFCSPGGRVDHGLEMYQAFRDHGNVHAHAFGMNASISTIAMLGCKTIDIVKGSMFLIHNASQVVFTWEQTNKERLDQLISELELTRESLANIDEVLASMYAEKTGKPIDDIKAQMKRGTWMTAQQALDWGLVDSIREDKVTENRAVALVSDFANYFNAHPEQFKDSGIPPMPKDNSTEVADSQGNPTPSFIDRVVKAVAQMFNGSQQENKVSTNSSNDNLMKKIVNSVSALLNLKEGVEVHDNGSIALTEEQLQNISNELDTRANAINEKTTALDEANKQVETLTNAKATLEQEVKDLKEQVENLQKAPGAEDNSSKPLDTTDALSMAEVFNSISEI